MHDDVIVTSSEGSSTLSTNSSRTHEIRRGHWPYGLEGVERSTGGGGTTQMVTGMSSGDHGRGGVARSSITAAN